MSGTSAPTAGGLRAPQLAQLLALESERRVQQLAKEGVIPKAKRGVYPPSAIPAYIRYLREQQKEGARRGPLPQWQEERVRKLSAERELAELELKKRRSEWAPIVDMDRAVERLATAVRAEVLGLRSRFVGRIVGLTTPAEAATVLDAMQAQILAALQARAEAIEAEDDTPDEEQAA